MSPKPRVCGWAPSLGGRLASFFFGVSMDDEPGRHAVRLQNFAFERPKCERVDIWTLTNFIRFTHKLMFFLPYGVDHR